VASYSLEASAGVPASERTSVQAIATCVSNPAAIGARIVLGSEDGQPPKLAVHVSVPDAEAGAQDTVTSPGVMPPKKDSPAEVVAVGDVEGAPVLVR
jgi:hypothetical protein